MSFSKIKQKYVAVSLNKVIMTILSGVFLFNLFGVVGSTRAFAAEEKQNCSVEAPAKVENGVNVDPVKVCKEKDVEKAINGVCGGGDYAVKIAIDIGCKGQGNPILDAVFAIIRFLTLGVGLVIIASTVFAGVQYTASRGDPNATAQAMKRITSNVGALLLFILTYAILNWLVPGMILQ